MCACTFVRVCVCVCLSDHYQQLLLQQEVSLAYLADALGQSALQKHLMKKVD